MINWARLAEELESDEYSDRATIFLGNNMSALMVTRVRWDGSFLSVWVTESASTSQVGFGGAGGEKVQMEYAVNEDLVTHVSWPYKKSA